MKRLTRGSGKLLTLGCWLTAAATAACGGQALDIGSDSSGGGASPLGGTTASASGGTSYGGAGKSDAGASDGYPPEDPENIQWPTAQACEPAPESPLVGSWKGRYPLPNGDTAEAVLTIAGLTPEGVPCGTFRVGEGAPLAPPTDPDAIYPDGVSLTGIARSHPISKPWPGYEYELLRVSSEGTRLAFMLSFGEILRPWCQMQTAYADSGTCLPDYTSGMGTIGGSGNNTCTIEGPSLPATQVPCWKLQYCATGTCSCYDGSCDAALNLTAFELHWDDQSLEGTVNGGTNLIFLDPVEP